MTKAQLAATICSTSSLVIVCSFMPAVAHAQCTEFTADVAQIEAIVASDKGNFEKADDLFGHVKNRTAMWETRDRKDELEVVVRFIANRLLVGENSGAAIAKGLEAGTCKAVADVAAGHDRLTVAQAASTAAGVNAPDSEEEVAAIGEVGSDRDYIRLYTGVVESLEADGSWESNGELSFVSTHDWSPFKFCEDNDFETTAAEERCENARPHQIRGTAEFEFSELGAIQDGEETEEGGEPAPAPAPGMDLDPFASGGGIFRFNASGAYQLRNAQDLRVVGGIGFTTQPDKSLSASSAKGRYYVGLRIDNPKLGAGREAFLMIGMAKDKLWQFNETVDVAGIPTVVFRDESERYVIEGRLTIPGVFGEGRNVWLSGRVFADLPRSGDGPSDIRVSLHVSSDIDRLFNR
jgi:hypothetical protein